MTLEMFTNLAIGFVTGGAVAILLASSVLDKLLDFFTK